MASRYDTPKNTKEDTEYTKYTFTSPTRTTSTTTSGTSSSARETVNTINMTPESLAALQNLIQALQSGGTNEQRASIAKRQQALEFVKQLFDAVSTRQAFIDAEALMALNLQKALEQNMPAIQRAIEGAGTSASSMQGLLSQKMARDAALAAGALGAQQAQVYAQQRSNLANTLEALTRPTNDVTQALINALNISKGAVTRSTRDLSQSSSTYSNTVTNNSGQRIVEKFFPYDTDSSYWSPQSITLADWLRNPAL